ncbi:MAG: hypothetical protein HY996_12340 [Micrococcales bacterium]|nr:hypothetical protein [Micrococcales bacterium]
MSRLPAILLGPVVLAQANALRRATPLLDPPPQPWGGVAGGRPEGTGAAQRILVIGDSTAIGTGVGAASESLGARVAARLSALDGSAVVWHATGHNGDTAAEVRRDFLPGVLRDLGGTDAPAGTAIVLVGWNDAMHLRSGRAFAADLTVLVRSLGARSRVLVVAAPHFERLAVLRQPLRLALGSAAAGLRREALAVCRREGATLVPGFDGASTASDGFHPDAAGYDRMAAAVVTALAS